MALIPTTTQETALTKSSKKHIFINTISAGSNSIAYTVPANKKFKGYIVFKNPVNNAQGKLIVNGILFEYYSTDGNKENMPIFLNAGDTIANSGTLYFVITGVEE